jgi:hypothetical protein
MLPFPPLDLFFHRRSSLATFLRKKEDRVEIVG